MRVLIYVFVVFRRKLQPFIVAFIICRGVEVIFVEQPLCMAQPFVLGA